MYSAALFSSLVTCISSMRLNTVWSVPGSSTLNTSPPVVRLMLTISPRASDSWMLTV
jgi:hypothetical protein